MDKKPEHQLLAGQLSSEASLTPLITDFLVAEEKSSFLGVALKSKPLRCLPGSNFFVLHFIYFI